MFVKCAVLAAALSLAASQPAFAGYDFCGPPVSPPGYGHGKGKGHDKGWGRGHYEHGNGNGYGHSKYDCDFDRDWVKKTVFIALKDFFDDRDHHGSKQ